MVGTHASGDVIFGSLDIKTSGVENLKEQACGGVEIVDTEDFYDEACALYPELGVGKVNARMKMIGDHYNSKHI